MRSGEGASRSSPLTIVSDSDSDSALHLLTTRRKRPLVLTPPELSDSDDGRPHSKPDPKVAKMFKELKEELQHIKDMKDDVEEIKSTVRESNKIATLREMFTCLICKEVATEDNRPTMLPCCRSAVCCYECINRWLGHSHFCPHCREEVRIESCLSQPLLRPLFDLLQQ